MSERSTSYRGKPSLIEKIIGVRHDESPEEFHGGRALTPAYLIFKARQRATHYNRENKMTIGRRFKLIGMAAAGLTLLLGYGAAIFAGFGKIYTITRA